MCFRGDVHTPFVAACGALHLVSCFSLTVCCDVSGDTCTVFISDVVLVNGQRDWFCMVHGTCMILSPALLGPATHTPPAQALIYFHLLSFRMPAPVSQQFKFRTPFTRRWDSLPRHVYDTLVDEGFSPRQSDGELLALFCLRPRRHPDIDREFVIEGTRVSHLFQDPDSRLATAQFIHSDYLVDLVAAALGRLPQPLSPDWATETWLEFHRLLEAVGAGKPSHLLTPLQTQ